MPKYHDDIEQGTEFDTLLPSGRNLNQNKETKNTIMIIIISAEFLSAGTGLTSKIFIIGQSGTDTKTI